MATNEGDTITVSESDKEIIVVEMTETIIPDKYWRIRDDLKLEEVELRLDKHFLQSVTKAIPHEIKLYDLLLISDVRGNIYPNLTSSQYDKFKNTIANPGPLELYTFTIVYRTETKWHYIVRPSFYYFMGNNSEKVQEWLKAINSACIRKNFLSISILDQIEKMYNHILLTVGSTNFISSEIIGNVLNCDSKRKQKVLATLRNINAIDATAQNIALDKFTFEIFYQLYLALTQNRPDIATHCIPKKKIDNDAINRNCLTNSEFLDFINTHQRDSRLNNLTNPPLTVRMIGKLITKYDLKSESVTNQTKFSNDNLTFEGFSKFLLSQDNFDIDLSQFESLQDFDQPLSHYYINSSHNSYLEGRQVMAQASCEMYRQILLLGCRCIELDCWDGDNDEPVITHGRSFVNKMPFEEAVKVIAEYAFLTSEYPLVLSFENHTRNTTVQEKMVNYCITHFGDMLLDNPLDTHPLEEGVFLPSPNLLKRKILIKNKRSVPQDKLVKTHSTTGSVVMDSPFRAAGADSRPWESRPRTKRDSTASINEYNFLKEMEPELNPVLGKVDMLVNYVQATRFQGFETAENKDVSYEIISFSETKAYGYAISHYKEFSMHNKFQISRIYPYWRRMNSDNLMPQLFWDVGCQMVALNFQTPDTPIMLNHTKFEYNDNKGYILKPACLRENRNESFNTFAQVSIPNVIPAHFEMRVISAQFIRPDLQCKIYATAEIYGLPVDTLTEESSWTTNHVSNNFQIEFDAESWFIVDRILLPDLALLKLTVYDENHKYLAHRVLSFIGLQTGYRHILLRDQNNHPCGLSSLFVQIKLEDFVPPEAKAIVDALVNPGPAIIQIQEPINEDTNKLRDIVIKRYLIGVDIKDLETNINDECEMNAKLPKLTNKTALDMERKMPNILIQIINRDHTIEIEKRDGVVEYKEIKKLTENQTKDTNKLRDRQMNEHYKFVKSLEKQRSDFERIQLKETKAINSPPNGEIRLEVEEKMKRKENELDNLLQEKDMNYQKAEEILKITHRIQLNVLTLTLLKKKYSQQIKTVEKRFEMECKKMLESLEDERSQLIKSVAHNYLDDKASLSRIKTDLNEMKLRKQKKYSHKLQRFHKIELNKLLQNQSAYLNSIEKENDYLNGKIADLKFI